MTYRGRFAPSPTGLLHFGSLVAALGSWLCARHAGGQWLLRMDDLDPPREVTGSANAILAALPAFSLVADGPVLFQSQRRAAYDAAFAQLQRDERVFPCWCSRADLAAHGPHRDGRCVAPPDPQRAPAWRLRAPDAEIAYLDALQGPQRQNLREQGDYVLRRADGIPAYQLACVVDDAHQGITEVVRGCDLLDSTPRQIHLQRLLGLPTPRYLHLPLVLDAAGRKLCKSSLAPAIAPADPVPALRRALAFLQLPHQADDVASLLGEARRQFSPHDLTQRSGYLPPDAL